MTREDAGGSRYAHNPATTSTVCPICHRRLGHAAQPDAVGGHTAAVPLERHRGNRHAGGNAILPHPRGEGLGWRAKHPVGQRLEAARNCRAIRDARGQHRRWRTSEGMGGATFVIGAAMPGIRKLSTHREITET